MWCAFIPNLKFHISFSVSVITIILFSLFLSPGGERQVLLVRKTPEPPEIQSKKTQTEESEKGLLLEIFNANSTQYKFLP